MIDPYMKTLFIELGLFLLIGVYGLYCAKREREEFRARYGKKDVR
jgi:hypothetical protein